VLYAIIRILQILAKLLFYSSSILHHYRLKNLKKWVVTASSQNFLDEVQPFYIKYMPSSVVKGKRDHKEVKNEASSDTTLHYIAS
jgi:hypothetical protein